jgi:hypothetical protein
MAFAGLWEGFKWAGWHGDTLVHYHHHQRQTRRSVNCITGLADVPPTLLRPAADDVLKVWPVSKQVNSPRNNNAELLERVGMTLASMDNGDQLSPICERSFRSDVLLPDITMGAYSHFCLANPAFRRPSSMWS